MKVEQIDFRIIRDVWKYHVWPDERVTTATDPQQYRGNIDDIIVQKYQPSFYAIKRDMIIIGAIGGHRTTSSLYRVRGLFLDEKSAKKHLVLANALVSAIGAQAKREGCHHMWDILSDEGDILHKLAFNKTEDFDEGHHYALCGLR